MFTILVSSTLGYLAGEPSDEKLATSSEPRLAKGYHRRFAAECAQASLRNAGYAGALVVTIAKQS
jgi:hypothetical protein